MDGSAAASDVSPESPGTGAEAIARPDAPRDRQADANTDANTDDMDVDKDLGPVLSGIDVPPGLRMFEGPFPKWRR